MMKKRFFVILGVVMILAIMGPLGVAADEGVEKYIPKIKKTFNIGDEYGDLNVFTHDYRGETTYDLSWRNNNDHISVEIDVDGNFIRYGNYSSRDRDEHGRFPKISKEAALKSAEEIIRRIDPGLLGKVEYDDSGMLGNLNTYHFRFVRKENNIAYNHNMVSVEVDNLTGEIRNVDIHWDKDIKLPNTEDIIDEEKADDLYKEDQDAELVYRMENKDNKLEGNLLYTIKDRNKAIDAKSGEVVKNLNSINDYVYYGFLFGNMKKVSIEEQQKLINNKEVVSKDAAVKKLRSFANLDSSYTIQETNLRKSELDGSYVWEIGIHKQEGDSGYGTSVYVNAKTNEVLNFHNFSGREDEEEKYSEEEARAKAEKFLKEKMEDKFKEVEFAGSMFYEYQDKIRQYSFTFTRVIDGIRVPQNGFSLSISSVTGEIMNYDHMWSNIEVPSREDIMEREKAKNVLLDDVDLELNYIIDRDSIKNKKKEIKLVYNLSSESSVFIDAKTGEKISSTDFFGIGYADEREKEYGDIEESYAKDEIEKLKENGIYLPGEDFLPREDICQKDFLFLLSNTRGYISPYNDEYIYERFLREDIVRTEEKNPDKAITRGEAIKYVVRSFGQEKAANFGDIYKSNYADMNIIPKELKGYVAVAEGLGVISGKGNFRANDNLTRQEAAMIIFNILNRD